MTDNQLIALTISIMKPMLFTRLPELNVVVKQSNQPRAQGANEAPTIYMFKVGDKLVGFPARADVWDPDAEEMLHTEAQLCETTFQVHGLVQQNPADEQSLTASDVTNCLAGIIQSDKCLAALRAVRVGLLRVTSVSNPYIVNDKNRHEATPSFDFVLTHRRAYTDTVPVAASVEASINRV